MQVSLGSAPRGFPAGVGRCNGAKYSSVPLLLYSLCNSGRVSRPSHTVLYTFNMKLAYNDVTAGFDGARFCTPIGGG